MLNILLPVANPAILTADDTWIINRLLASGNTVSVVSHTAVVPANVANYQVVVFPTSMQSNQTAKWDNVAIGVVSVHLGKFLHTNMSSVTFASNGDTRLTRFFAAHAVSDTLSGVVTVYGSTPLTGYKYITPANLAPNVQIYSGHDSSLTRATGIAIEQGTVLLNASVSPSRRVTIPADEVTLLNTAGAALFDRAVVWAANGATAPVDTQAPSVPTNLNASAAGSDVTLTWTASTDDTAVSGYQVHRSTAPGFAPDGSTLIGTAVIATYNDPGLTNNTYYYSVVAYDAANNFSSPSALTQITIGEILVVGTGPFKILAVIANTASQTADDTWLVNFLTTRGHTVVPFTASSGIPFDINTYNLIIFSTSPNSNQLAPKWNTNTVPVVSLTMSKKVHTNAHTVSSSLGDLRQDFYFFSHSITNPLAGVQQVYSTAPVVNYAWVAPADMPAGATVLAAHNSGNTRVVAYAFNAGSVMASGVFSPSRRVALPFGDPSKMGAAGEALVERAIVWAARLSEPPVISAFEMVGGSPVALASVGIWNGTSLVHVATTSLSAGAIIPDPDPNPDPGPWTLGAKPSNTNVGVPGIGEPALTALGGGTNNVSNITYTNRLVTGDITFYGSNINIIGCRFTGRVVIRDGNNFVIEDSDFGALSVSGGTNVTMRRIRTTGFAGSDGLHITSYGKRCTDIVVEDSYIGNPTLSAGSHYDSIQVRGVDRLTIRGNYFDQSTTFSSSYNATIFLEDTQGGNYYIDIYNNWLRAAGYYNVRLFGYNQTLNDNIFIKRDPTESDGSPNAGPVIGNSYAYTASGNTWDGGQALVLP